MNIEWLREYALSKEEVTESFPFGEDTLVFKANGKIFLLIALAEIPLRFNLKCDPEHALELREEHPDQIYAGYHMNKKHWNTIIADGKLKTQLIKKLIDESFNLVYHKKKKK